MITKKYYKENLGSYAQFRYIEPPPNRLGANYSMRRQCAGETGYPLCLVPSTLGAPTCKVMPSPQARAKYNNCLRDKMGRPPRQIEPTDSCRQHKCGGYTRGIAPTCPAGCKCGQGNPRIPDAPRRCERVEGGVKPLVPRKKTEEQMKMNLDCAKEFGFPECLVYRTCEPKDVGMEITDEEWNDRNNKGSLANKKYAKAKCWEFCVAMKEGNETPNFMIKEQMERMGCNKYRSGGTNEMVKEALPWMIGGAVILVLIYKFK